MTGENRDSAFDTLGWRVEFATFWILGLVNNFTFVVFVTAAEDILHGYAGIILVCVVIPGLLSRIAFALCAERVPYWFRILIVSVSSTICCLVVALAESTTTKLLALIMQAAFGALGEMAFLSLTARFSDVSMDAWASGTGAAGIAGSGAYVFLTELLKFSPKTALIICSPIAMLLIILYQKILAPRARFQAVPAESTDQVELEDANFMLDSTDSEENISSITRKEWFKTLLFTYMLPLAIVYFAEYAINEGVQGTLTKYRDGRKYESNIIYRNLQFTYQIAVWISRSSRRFFQVHRLWILPVLQMGNLIFITLSSMYVWLPSPRFAFLLTAWEGLLGGLCYVNAFARLRQEAPVHLKEWALGTATVGDATGISIAALVSVWLEKAIINFRGS